MNTLRHITHLLSASVLTAITVGLASTAQAFSVSQSPLFLAGNVKPNVILGLDDSGSMDSEVIFETNDGALWWNTDINSFVGLDADDNLAEGVINYNDEGGADGDWYKYVYLFPNGASNNQPDRRYGDTPNNNNHFAIPPRPEYAFARSSDYNTLYYNPRQTYEPWASYAGQVFTDSVPTAARFDPVYGTNADTLNLTADFDTSTEGGNWDFYLYPGMRQADGTAVTTRGNRDFTYYPATYYVRTDTSTISYSYDGFTVDTVTVPGQTVDCASSGPAEYRIFERQLTTFNFPPGITALGPDGACLLEYQVRSSSNAYPFGGFDTRTDCAAATCTYAEEIQNFANWFTYYRRRHHAMRAGIGQAFIDLGGLRVEALTFSNRTRSVAMLDIDEPADRETLLENLYDVATSGGGTPTRETLHSIGEEYSDNNSVIEASCQQNFAVIFTDGFAGSSTAHGDEADNAAGPPYADTYGGTLGDIAMYYYGNGTTGDAVPLRTPSGLPGYPVGVPVADACTNPDVTADPWEDCNEELHMNTYAVTLGAKGTLWPDTYPTVESAYGPTPPPWPNTAGAGRDPVMVDDLFHATVNGRGEKLRATSPEEIEQAFKTILGDIVDDIGAASSVATNSTRLDAGTLIYQAVFNSTDWSGELLALAVDTTTGIPADRADAAWNAATLLDARVLNSAATPRNIITYDGSQGIEFEFDNLSAGEQALLGGTDRGRAVVEFIRGSRDCEEDPSGAFSSRPCTHDVNGDSVTNDDDKALRERASVLGDIVNSDPAFSGAQNFGFALFDPSYTAFVADKAANRRAAVFVGANDGMLHAFDASAVLANGGGEELFAYVPGTLIPHLADLASPNYVHRYYVDGSPVVIDAKIQVGGSGPVAWRTLLIGSTGAGGRTVFALDVSKNDLRTFDRDDVLWEMTDPSLGVSIPRPQVARFASDTWVLLVPNGYNSANNRASLLVLDLEDGSVLAELDTGVGSSADPNGLGPVIAVDIDTDGEVEYAYAGDMHGNLWRFEFGGSEPGDWDITDYSTAVSGNQGLFQACAGTVCTSANRQPITARPSVTRHPDGGLVVLVGTGSYFQVGDNAAPTSSTVIESFYALRDLTNDATPARIDSRSALQQQTILGEVVSAGESYRVTSNASVDYGTRRGWYIDLAYPAGSRTGERVVNPAILREDRVLFTSLIPESGVCLSGGSGWLMVMDAITGSRLEYSPLDTNNDATIDGDDLVAFDLDGDDTPENVEVSGKGYERIVEFSEEGFMSGPTVGTEVGQGARSDGTIQSELLGQQPGLFGRQSWFQVSPPVDD